MPLARSRISFAFLLVVMLVPALCAQIVVPKQGEAVPAFEVATIKPSSRDLGRSFHTHIWWNDNTYSTENTTLRDLLHNAFNISSGQMIGGPGALLDSRWDINAKIGEEEYAQLQKLPSDDRERAIHLMLDRLLADRFGLKFHTETRQLPVFDLVVDKGGPKLEPAPDPAAATPVAASKSPSAASAAPPSSSGNVTVRIGRDQASLSASDRTLEALVANLERQSELDGRIVIDKTGLTGKYNYSLHWSPQRLNAAADPDAEGPSLVTALREQLGLRLEPSKGPVQVVVIDALSNPTPN